jgi:hypothetical protein
MSTTYTTNAPQRAAAMNAHKLDYIGALVAARGVGEDLGAKGYDVNRAAAFAARFFDDEAFGLLLNKPFWAGFSARRTNMEGVVPAPRW